jgi:CBS domain containing-hemolysin-like protein
MEWIADPAVWIGLATLVALEVVLGVDNLIFIAILADKLPPEQRQRARLIGLSLALIMRLALLASISWVMSLTTPVVSLWSLEISWRDLILIAGGLFLLVKATMEIHHRVEAQSAGPHAAPAHAAFWPVVTQIIVLDVVFSLDSVITAVGMVDQLYVMMAAVVIAVAAMLIAAKPLTEFITARPSLVILCLGFLLMVGLVLVVDGLGIHIPKGYVYAAMGFSVLIEALNQTAARNRRKYVASLSPRQRVTDAVLRLLGGVPLSDASPSDASPGDSVLSPMEARMMHDVLSLSNRSVAAIMTPRLAVEWLDAEAAVDSILARVRSSPHREFPVGRGTIEEVIGVVRKEDILASCLAGESLMLDKLLRTPLVIPRPASVLAALDLLRGTTEEMMIVVDEYGDFQGVVTRTDVLEAIAGEMPDRGETPDVKELSDGALSIDGAMAIGELRRRLGLRELPKGEYSTAAGFMLALLGHIPAQGERADWGGWRFEVEALDGVRVSRLIARAASAPDPALDRLPI